MGSYVYKVYGPVFNVEIDGENRQARLSKYWMKPWYDIFDHALYGGKCPSYFSDSEKRIYRSYTLQLGKLNTSEAVYVFVLSEDGDRNPGEGDMVLIYKTPRRFVWDDPNWEGAEIRYLHRTETGWQACVGKPVAEALV